MARSSLRRHSNREDGIDLLSVQETGPGTGFEVLVGLDGEPAEVVETLPSGFDFDLQYFPLPRVGISTAKNAVWAEARGRIMLLLNDDVEPEPGKAAREIGG